MTAETLIIKRINDTRTGRIRARKVDVQKTIAEAIEDAKQSRDGVGHKASHGGGVCNSYGYPADTEAAFAAAIVDGGEIHAYWWAGQLPANKVTLSGVVTTLVGAEIRPLYDFRYGKAATVAARKWLRDLLRELRAADAGLEIITLEPAE